jgi:hypothetical protein
MNYYFCFVGVLCILSEFQVHAYRTSIPKRLQRKNCNIDMCSDEGGEVDDDIRNKKAITDISSLDLNALFGLVKKFEAIDQPIPTDVKDAIAEKIQMGAPSEFEMRLKILGLNNPLTQAGFALAFVLITLNTVLGNGWAANLLGMDTDSSFIVVDGNKRNPISSSDGSVEDFRFNYEAYQKNRQDINVDREQDIPIEIFDEKR